MDYRRLATWPRLPENAQIDALESLADAYVRRCGVEPVNVSHWDPSREFADRLQLKIPIDSAGSAIPYRYSYMVIDRDAVLRKLGFGRPQVSGLFTENGSASIAAVANFLALAKVASVKLFCPSYFITEHNLRRLGISVDYVPVPRQDRCYRWPEGLSISRGQALWITNPIYNTGDCSLESYVPEILQAVESGAFVVMDEALAFSPTRFSQEVGGHPNFLAIHTPHKSICVNRIKFSVIAFHSDLEDLFDDWADVLSGGLSFSSTAAIAHFLSAEFDRYTSEFVHMVEEARHWHQALVNEIAPAIDTDETTRGHFLTVYFPRLPAVLGESIQFIEEVLAATGATFIPGTRNRFEPAYGLSFRVNLALDSPQFRGALTRLYRWLAR